MSDTAGGLSREAELDPSGELEAAEESARDTSIHGDALVGATGDGGSDPDALVEGNRVATAEDME